MSESHPTRLSVLLLWSTVGGCMYFLGFVGFELTPLIFVCFVPALHALRDVRPRRALLLGTVFGLVTNLGGYYWVIHLLKEFANLATPLALLGYVLLCLYQGFLLAIVLTIVHRLQDRLQVAPVWSLPAAFCALELTYPLLFPSYIGNALYRIPVLTQIVDVTGMLGLTALIGLVNGAVYELWAARRDQRPIVRARAAVPMAVVVATVVYGLVRIPMVDEQARAARTSKVAMIQTNLGARDKAGMRDEFIRRHRAMSLEAVEAHPDLDLIVWPESAYNRWISRAETDLSAITKGIGKPVLFGALTYDRGPDRAARKYNTALLVDGAGRRLGLFDKVVLLAFGETIPFIDTFPFVKAWLPRTSLFTRGETFEHMRLDASTRLLTMICYEDIIPSLVRQIIDNDGPPEALVNITNDSWYGDTHEPLIHLALATFRSIETRRAMIRSTNTGISAFVDPVGRIVSRTQQWKQETIVHQVPMIDDGSVPVYQTIGDLLGWLSLLGIAFGLVASRRKGEVKG